MDFRTDSSEKLITNDSLEEIKTIKDDEKTMKQEPNTSTLSPTLMKEEETAGEHGQITVNAHNTEHNNENKQNNDTPNAWYRMGTDRSFNDNIDLSLEQKYEEFCQDVRHEANYKASFDVYQVLAFRAKIGHDSNNYIKPFKTLTGVIPKKWSDFEFRWLNSYHRVLFQAIIVWIIQTIGITAILVTQFASYINDDQGKAKCDYTLEGWKKDAHLKILA
eukprot:130616_1